MLGRILSHYKVTAELGAGGMGVVYRARDERLGRDVALKILGDATLANEEARARFRREAMALSRLSHPNIATIHDFDSQEGIDFLVMECVEGQTLRDKLAMGPLSEQEALAIGLQIAEALDEAHERGVIHRDLKPGNVILGPKSRVKVLDFGLAKLLDIGTDGETIAASSTGTWSGTVPYMPPEQLEGQRTDARSDLYALGAILYEAASGRRAFAAPSAARLFSEILNERPLPPSKVRATLSPGFDAVVMQLLEKDPAKRPASAREVIQRLSALAKGEALVGAAAGTGATAAPSAAERPKTIEGIVVLPLENLSGDPDQEFFADGMTEELISSLAQFQALRVISRTSAMRYKRTQKTLREIGNELNVDAVVEGTVRRHGGRVRITAQLIDVATDRHLWAKNYERDLQDVLALQGEVAQAIAGEIQVKVTPQEEARLAKAHAVNPEAYEAYLRGRQHWNRRTAESLLQSLEYFRTAVEMDPEWATAHVGLADAYNVIGFYGALPPGDSFPKGRAAAATALRLDPDLAEAHAAVGYAEHYHDWNWAAAEKSFRRAIELNDNQAYSHLFYMNYLIAMGHFEVAQRESNRAFELDPLSMIINIARGWGRFFARDFERAGELIEEALEADPHFHTTYAWLAPTYEALGRYPESLAIAERAAELSGRGSWGLVGIARALVRLGRREEAEAVRLELHDLATMRYVSAYEIALAEAAFGNRDEAIAQLERAYATRANHLVLLRVDPRLDTLRDDARFRDIERRMAFPVPPKSP
jgi:TolB-like protein/lipoprotein NlpI